MDVFPRLHHREPGLGSSAHTEHGWKSEDRQCIQKLPLEEALGPKSDGLSCPTARAWFIAVPGASPRPAGLEQVSGNQLPSLPFNQASSCPGPCPLWPLPNARNRPCPGKYHRLPDLCLVRKKVAQCGRRIRPWGHVVLSPQLCSIHLCHWETRFPLHCPGGDASVSKCTPKGPLNTELLPCRLRFKWCLE